MKRSEMKAVLIHNGSPDYALNDSQAEQRLLSMEAKGMTWDKEEDEWPELEYRVHGQSTRLLYLACCPSTEAIASQIASLWNIRRPGGAMESCLLELAELMEIQGNTNYSSSIRRALEIGMIHRSPRIDYVCVSP